MSAALKPTTSWIKYAVDETGYGARNHCCAVEFEADLIARIKSAYGYEPVEVERLRGHSLWLDSGGVVLRQMGWVRHRFRRYSVRCREEHALLYAGELVRRLEDTERHRVYAGELCLTLYQRFWSPVIPVAHARKLVDILKRDGVANHTRATSLLAAVGASSPHIDVGIKPIGDES